MTGFIIALISGALMSVQGVFNTQVTKTTGMWVSNMWVQFSAFIVCLVVWFVAGRDPIGGILEVQHAICCSEEQSEQGSPGLLSKAWTS